MTILSDLEANAGKTPYQSYTIKRGIERFDVLIPFKNAKAFEDEIAKSKTLTRQSLLKIISDHGGRLK